MAIRMMVQSSPPKILENMWLRDNAEMIRSMGAEAYLTGLVNEVRREFGHNERANRRIRTDLTNRSILAAPGIEMMIHSKPPKAIEQAWLKDHCYLIEKLGPEAYLSDMLDELRSRYG